MNKRSIIVILVGLNLFLLSALMLTAASPARAMAQRIGGAGNFLTLTNKIDADIDALFLVDLPDRKLHAFAPQRDEGGRLAYIGGRDLEEDFRTAGNVENKGKTKKD